MLRNILAMVMILLPGCATPMPAAMSQKSVVFRPCTLQVTTCSPAGCMEATREALCQAEEMIIIRPGGYDQ